MGAKHKRQRSPIVQAGTGNGPRRHKPDYALSIIAIILLVVGLIVVYAISPGLAVQTGLADGYFIQRQLAAIALAVITFFVVAKLPLQAWPKLVKPLLLVTVAALLATQFLGTEVNNATRWIQIGGFSFQAVELLKFTLIIWLASFLAKRYDEGTINNIHKTVKPVGLVLLGIGFVVAVLQSDLGSTGVIAAIMATMLFASGLSWRWLGAGIATILVAGSLLIAVSPYRQERIMTFFNPQADCLEEGYQACQALIAIGSGGLFGKGIDRSTQAYGYLPEAANDAIFAVLAEMFGFLGVVLVLGLFVALFTKLFRIIERSPNMGTRLMTVGVLAWLSTQAFMNIMAMVGLLPLKGITLPFISYGGTSIIFVTAAVALVFNISRYTTFTVFEQATSNRHQARKDTHNDRTTQRRRHGWTRHTDPVHRA